MKRLAAVLILLLALLLGTVAFSAPPTAAAPAAPESVTAPDRSESVSAPRHTISSTTSWNICHIKAQERANQGMAGAGGTVYAWNRSFHYGTAHITQCQLAVASPIGQGTYLECWQYVWNVSSPSWSKWKQGFYPTVSPCW
jgi:hypothetical protein